MYNYYVAIIMRSPSLRSRGSLVLRVLRVLMVLHVLIVFRVLGSPRSHGFPVLLVLMVLLFSAFS